MVRKDREEIRKESDDANSAVTTASYLWHAALCVVQCAVLCCSNVMQHEVGK